MRARKLQREDSKGKKALTSKRRWIRVAFLKRRETAQATGDGPIINKCLAMFDEPWAIAIRWNTGVVMGGVGVESFNVGDKGELISLVGEAGEAGRAGRASRAGKAGKAGTDRDSERPQTKSLQALRGTSGGRWGVACSEGLQCMRRSTL